MLFFWALGGSGTAPNFLWIPFLSNGYYRRLGVPLVLFGLIALNFHSWIPLLSILAVAVGGFGYGIPSPAPGMAWDDKGSLIGRFVYWHICNQNEKLSTIVTRAIVSTVLALKWLSLVFINLPIYLISSVALIIGIPIIVNSPIQGELIIKIGK